MTRQEIDQMFAALDLITGRIGDLNSLLADILMRLDDLCGCISDTPSGKSLRIVDLDRE